jgi:hypothetical protein
MSDFTSTVKNTFNAEQAEVIFDAVDSLKKSYKDVDMLEYDDKGVCLDIMINDEDRVNIWIHLYDEESFELSYEAFKMSTCTTRVPYGDTYASFDTEDMKLVAAEEGMISYIDELEDDLRAIVKNNDHSDEFYDPYY